MKRKGLRVTYLALFLVALLTAGAGAATPTLQYNGNSLKSDTPPVISNNSTLVPIRVISEAMGAQVGWDQDSMTATIVRDDTTVKLTVGRWVAEVNGQQASLNAPVTIINSRTMAPVRFISENLGCIVGWDAATSTVKIFYLGDRLLKSGDSGEDVRGLQLLLNDCGYTVSPVDGIFGDSTNQAVTSFQKDQGLTVDGVVGPRTRSDLAARAGGSQISGSAAGHVAYGEATSWWDVNPIWKVGTVATVTDFDTGLSYKVKRMGGYNHADVEPLTAADTAIMLRIYGGEWSWNRRAIIVTYGSYRWAASQNGMPHGEQTIFDNNFDGQFCIHFKDSLTHGNNQWDPNPPAVDPAHQAMVRKAAGLDN